MLLCHRDLVDHMVSARHMALAVRMALAAHMVLAARMTLLGRMVPLARMALVVQMMPAALAVLARKALTIERVCFYAEAPSRSTGLQDRLAVHAAQASPGLGQYRPQRSSRVLYDREKRIFDGVAAAAVHLRVDLAFGLRGGPLHMRDLQGRALRRIP